MASQDQKFRAGEAKGRAQEKTGEMMGGVKEKKEQAGGYVSEKAGAARDKASEMGQSAEAGKEKSGGLIGRTGEQVKSMAQGAAEAVKHTLGMAGDDEDDATATTGKNNVLDTF